MKKFGDEILNSLAPELAHFTAAEIPEVEAEFPSCRVWMSNYFRYTLLTSKRYTEEARPHHVTFLLRAQSLFRNYSRAKRSTEEFLASLAPNNPPIDKYFAALNDWEHTVLDWGIAIESYNEFGMGKAIDNKSERDKFESATYRLYNTIKHWSPNFAQQRRPGDTVPVWLVTGGLASRAAPTVPFSELARLVHDVGRVANEVQAPGASHKPLDEGEPMLPTAHDGAGQAPSTPATSLKA